MRALDSAAERESMSRSEVARMAIHEGATRLTRGAPPSWIPSDASHGSRPGEDPSGRIAVHITAETKELVESRSIELGRRRSEIIRTAIAEWIREETTP